MIEEPQQQRWTGPETDVVWQGPETDAIGYKPAPPSTNLPRMSQYNPPNPVMRALTVVREGLSPLIGYTERQRLNQHFLEGTDTVTSQGLLPAALQSLTTTATPIAPFEHDPNDSVTMDRLKGAANAGIGIENFMTSPLGVGTMGLGTVPALRKPVAGLFGAYMASQVPEAARQAGELSVTGTPGQQVESDINLGLNVALPGLLGASLARPTPPAAEMLPGQELQVRPKPRPKVPMNGGSVTKTFTAEPVRIPVISW